MLIAFEGIDGSGKGTQAALLKEKMQSLGMSAEVLSFPRYGQTLFAKCVASYLNGEFGDLASVPPKSAALLYAGDRFESLDIILQLAHSQDVVIFDRYVASNLAHQAAKVGEESRQGFMAWLARIEYEVFGLPKPDFTLYLDMPVKVASEFIYKKKARDYTIEAADLHEKNTEYLAKCRDVYQLLVEENFDSRWFSIQCTQADGGIFNPMEVHASIWDTLQHLVYGSGKLEGD
jgi:dTMP kinase